MRGCAKPQIGTSKGAPFIKSQLRCIFKTKRKPSPQVCLHIQYMGVRRREGGGVGVSPAPFLLTLLHLKENQSLIEKRNRSALAK